jgi:O-antigen/teichoic acid export membrane protein
LPGSGAKKTSEASCCVAGGNIPDATAAPKVRAPRGGFLGDVGWFSLAQLVAGLMMLTYLMLAARLLGGAAEVGTYGQFQAVMGIYSIVGVLGFPLNLATIHLVGVARPHEQAAALGSCLLLALAVSGTCGATILAASPLLAAMLRIDSIAPLAAVAALLALVFVLTVCYGGLQGRNRYPGFAAAKVGEAFLSLVIGTGLMAAGTGVAGAVGGYACGMGAMTLMLLTRRGDYVFRWRGAPVRSELRTLALPLAVSIVLFCSLSGPMLVARWRLDETNAGLYAALFSFSNVFQPFALAVSLPLYSRIIAGRHEAAMLRKALAVVILLAGGFAAVSLVCPAFCIRLLLGAKFIPAAGYLWGYAVAVGLFMVAMVIMFHAAAERCLKLYLLPIPALGVVATAVWSELTIAKIVGLQVTAWALFLVTQTAATLAAGCRPCDVAPASGAVPSQPSNRPHET